MARAAPAGWWVWSFQHLNRKYSRTGVSSHRTPSPSLHTQPEAGTEQAFKKGALEGTVEPRKKYELVQDYGFHIKATFRLSEVDTIDSGM